MARWIFRIAAIYGLIALTPLYFLEAKVAAPAPLLAHPEHFYGFIGTALAAQVMFLVIASDPVRYRPLMLAGAPSGAVPPHPDPLPMGEGAGRQREAPSLSNPA